MSSRSAAGGSGPLYKLPQADGTAGYVMQTDGAGQAAWVHGSGVVPDPLTINTITISQDLKRPVSNVTQLTNITTTVVVAEATGTITTVDITAAPIAAGDKATFAVTCPPVAGTTSVVLATLTGHYGVLAGLPVVNVYQTVAGSFQLTIANAHHTDPMTGSFTIGYTVINPA